MGLDSLEIIELAENNKLVLYISSCNLMNVIYFLEKADKTNSEITLAVKNLLSFTTIISPNNSIVIDALDWDFKDIEDGIQYLTALQIKDIDYFITAILKILKKPQYNYPLLRPGNFWNYTRTAAL